MSAAFRFDEESMKVVRELSEYHKISIESVLSKAIGLMRIEAVYGPIYVQSTDGRYQVITLGGIDEIHENQIPEQK